MKSLAIASTLGKRMNLALFQIKKYSPEILIAAGVVGTVASTVLACKATIKAKDVLDETKTELDAIRDCVENPEITEEQYSEADHRKDLTIVYSQAAWKLTKLYAPAVALGALSIASIVTSNNIMRQRNVALAAAFHAVSKSFEGYQERVIERFGDAVHKELKYGIRQEKIEEEVVDENTGKVKKVKKNINVVDEHLSSPYAKFFDCGNDNWEKDAEYNHMFLNAQQNLANHMLKARRHLFLNDVYEMIGMDKTKAGQSVGWIYDPENPNHKGDNYIDFGMYDMYRNNGKCRDFVNGYERTILLDFNVDGDIRSLMDDPHYYQCFLK